MSEVAVSNLTLGYDRHPAVHHLSGVFAAGRVSAVVGPNGSGKSTLLKGLAGVLRPMTGRIDRGGVARRDIAYLAQDGTLERNFPITVQALVSMGLMNRKGLFGTIGAAERGCVAAALATVGLTGLEHRGLTEISGGQLQRALFARVIVQDAPVILLDEPFDGLDEATAHDLADLTRRWAAEGRTVIIVLHDLALVRALADDVLVLAREAVAWGPASEALCDETLAAARRQSGALDDHAGVCHADDGARAA